MYKYFVDKHLSIIKCVIFPIIVIVFKFIIDLAMVNITNNLMDLLLSAYFSQIESCIFQLIILIILFFGLGRKKCLNKIFIVKIPSLVLSSGVLIYIIIAIIYRMQDPIDKTLLLEGNISYHLMLQMRNINFIFNLMVLPCFWIIIRNITLEKNKK